MILILNCGSQSIKWKLFDSNLKIKKKERVDVFEKRNYEKILFGELERVKKYRKDIKKIGHRVVHGESVSKSHLLSLKII